VGNSQHNDYAGYTVDDWNWEFLKRNSRYIRLYKGVQRFKTWLGKKGFAPIASFTVFGKQFQFERDERSNGSEWCYKPNGKLKVTTFAALTTDGLGRPPFFYSSTLRR
jgi:hypothetical protein